MVKEDAVVKMAAALNAAQQSEARTTRYRMWCDGDAG
jgi:hypothetical protein